MRFSEIYFDPASNELFLVAPGSLNLSYRHVGAEGYLFCQWSNKKTGWARRRRHWVFIEKI